MVCAALLMLLASSVARAHPMRPNDDMIGPDSELIEGPFRDHQRRRPVRQPTPEELCERNKSWLRLVACLKKGGNTVTVLTDLGTGRLVSIKGSPTYDAATVYIYAQKNGRWERLQGYFSTNASTEILGFARLKTENGYRLEQGTVFKSSAALNERPFVGADTTRVPVTVRRKVTSICLDNGYCQTLVTSCDALVDGKARWSFRGQLLIDHGRVLLRGDKTYAGQICQPAPSQMSEVGDVLE